MPNPDFIPLPELLKQGRPGSFPVAVTGLGERNWEDFVRECAAWREAFLSRPGKRWALYSKDSWRFATALFGAWSAGRLLHVPGDAQPATSEMLSHEVDGFAGDFENGHGKELLKSHGALAGDSLFYALPSDLNALVLYTSGSTGKPAAIPKSLAQIASELESQEAVFGDRLGKARVLSTVSHQHIYGLLHKILWPLCAGRMIECRQLFYPEEILSAAESCSSALLVSSPAHLKRLPDNLKWHEALPIWRAVFSSGGPLSWESAELARKRFGKDVCEIYGSSETGGVAWRERVTELQAWTPYPKVELKVEGEVLQVKSPQLPGGAWFASSDRAKLLPGGGFELLGRLDRIVKIEEKRISLSAVEAALLGSGLASAVKVLPLPGARAELGAVVVPSPKGGELLKAGGKHPLNLALREAAALSIERVGLPRRWRYVEALPQDALGKSSEASLLKLFEEA